MCYAAIRFLDDAWSGGLDIEPGHRSIGVPGSQCSQFFSYPWSGEVVKSLGIGFPLLSYRSSATTSCLQCLCPTPLERLTWDAATCCWICLLLALDFVDIPSIQLTGHGFLEHRGIISACRSPSGNCMALLMHYWGFGFVSFSLDLVNIFLGFADFCHKRNYRCI